MGHLTKILGAAALGLLMAACADNTGPATTRAHFGAAGARGGTTRTTGGTQTAGGDSAAPADTVLGTEPTPLSFLPDAPPLTTYDTTFVAIQGQTSWFVIYFAGALAGNTQLQFMLLKVPSSAQFVDSTGAPLTRGSSVPITVQVDSRAVQFEFGPHGSTFSKQPATLSIYWKYTNLLGRDPGALKAWYQPNAGSTWSALPTTINLTSNWLTFDLSHFSNYRVAF